MDTFLWILIFILFVILIVIIVITCKKFQHSGRNTKNKNNQEYLINKDEKLYQPNITENLNEPKQISLQPEKLHVTVQSNQFNSSKYNNSSQDAVISIPSNDLQNNTNQNIFEKKNKSHQNQQYYQNINQQQTTTHILSDINNQSNKLAKSGSPLSIQQINQDDLLSIEQQQYKNVYGNQGTQNKELNQCVEKQHNLEIYQEDVRIENYLQNNQKIEDNKAIQNIIHKDEEPHIEVRIENYQQNNQKIEDNKAIQNIIHKNEEPHIEVRIENYLQNNQKIEDDKAIQNIIHKNEEPHIEVRIENYLQNIQKIEDDKAIQNIIHKDEEPHIEVRIENYLQNNQKIEDDKAIQNIIHKDEEPHIDVRIENYQQNNQKIEDDKAIQNIIHIDEEPHIVQPIVQPTDQPIVKPPSVIQQDKLSILQKIIDETSKKRVLADEYKYYIRRLQDKSELKKNYGLGLQASVKLYQYCNSFREVRGDGNCFYTAFGCQFLSILLFDYSYNQFQEFIDNIRENDISMKIFVTGTDLKIDDKELEKQLLEEFLNRLTQLKQIEDINQRKESFHTQFAAYEKISEEIDGCLYGLSTLFFRNYSNYILDFSDNKDAVYDREKLLKWEEECNSNEVIIAELAEHLNLFIQLIFIKDKDNIIVNQYGKLEHHKIILLIKPGHYNIGYFKHEEEKEAIQIQQKSNQKIEDNMAIQNIIHTDEEHHIIQPNVQSTDQPIVKPIVQPTSVIQQDTLSILQKIIDETSKKRVVEDEYKYYIRRLQDKSELKKNYGLGLQASVKLYQYCNSFREVRGDGNCFYTAFGCQFLSILLFDYSYNQFQEFIDKIRENDISMKIFVTGTDLKIDDKELEKQLLEEFLNRLTQLKQIEDINKRQEQFHTQFAAFEKQSEEIDGCLYGLSTIFFRNYSNYILDFSERKDAVFDREKLLKWEEECNSNEVIIAELAEQLNLFIQLIFIKDKDNIMVNQYGKLEHHKIILLIKPGHYNIGYLEENKGQEQQEDQNIY